MAAVSSITLAILAACCCTCSPAPKSRSVAERPANCGQVDPLGSAYELRTPIGRSDGVTIDAPEFCNEHHDWAGGAYIRVHGHGWRKFAIAHGCKEQPLDRATCPEIDVLAFADAVNEEMFRRLGTRGAGVGVCSDIFVDRSKWRGRSDLSSSVTRWRDADEAVEVVDAMLRRWDIGDAYGVSARGIICALE
jgi:hypothetical protein